MTMAKRSLYFADVTKLRILWWGDNSGLFGELIVITRVLKRGRQERQNQREAGRCSAAASDSGGRDHEPRNVGSPWKPEETRKQVLPSGLQKGHSPADTLMFSSVQSLSRVRLFSDFQNCKIIHVGCLSHLSLWYFIITE